MDVILACISPIIPRVAISTPIQANPFKIWPYKYILSKTDMTLRVVVIDARHTESKLVMMKNMNTWPSAEQVETPRIW